MEASLALKNKKIMGQLSPQKLHEIFINSIKDIVVYHSDLNKKPLEVDLEIAFPSKIRLYLYNLTDPPGGRTIGELKIQLIVPGQLRNCKGELNTSDNRIVLLAGYKPDIEVFVLWDAGLYPTFTYSRNIQVYTDAINSAIAGEIGLQERKLRVKIVETVVAVRSDMLIKGILKRMQLTIDRITNNL